MNAPKVSVVMPVCNAAAHIDESIASILRQTHEDFEFIIGDNGSTDDTLARAQQWRARDARIRILYSADRLGPARSSNWVVAEARYPLIARMDGDDIAWPDRLTRQLAGFARHRQAALIGTLFDTIDVTGRRLRPPAFARLRKPSPAAPFCHPSIMFRRDVFDAVGGYRPRADYWEDTDLFWRFAEVGEVYVLPEPLVTVRHWRGSSRSHRESAAVDDAVNRFYVAQAAYRAGADPFSLVEDVPARPGIPSAKLLPIAFASRAAALVWTGHRPNIAGRMYRRAAFGWDRRTMFATAYVLWATLAPRSLRACHLAWLNWINRSRNVDAGDDSPVRWSPRPSSVGPTDA